MTFTVSCRSAHTYTYTHTRKHTHILSLQSNEEERGGVSGRERETGEWHRYHKETVLTCMFVAYSLL